MYPLFALMLSAWRSMYYILNCSSYLKYRLRVSLRFNLSLHDFTANIIYGITDALSLWHKSFIDVWTLELRPGVRTESASPAWLDALVVFRTLKSCFFFQVLVELFHTMSRNPYRFFFYQSTYCFKLLPHYEIGQPQINSLSLNRSLW